MSTYYSCVGLPDGANPIPGQNILTQYILCQGDRTLDVKGCPNGKTYDPIKRICTETTAQGKILSKSIGELPCSFRSIYKGRQCS